MEDSRITELFTLRDESAVTETESKYGGYCHKLAFNILGDPNDAEETVSDALFQLWQAIPPEKPKSLHYLLSLHIREIRMLNLTTVYRISVLQSLQRKDMRNTVLLIVLEELPLQLLRSVRKLCPAKMTKEAVSVILSLQVGFKSNMTM